MIGANQPFAETQNWFGFGKRSSYQTDRVGGGVWKESRSYAYNGRGQLVYESDTPAPDSYGDYLYRFDFESLAAQPTGSGLGVRTAAMRRTGTALNDAQVGSWQVASSDAVRRPKSEGPATALNNYTLSDVSYDVVGQQTTRTLANGRTQSLTWDAAGRLIKLAERSTSNDGFDWSAVYDGLGRRMQTVQQPVSGGVASGAALTLGSIYDPQVEFLELGASLNGQRTWKVYGPDLDGRYGGLQGIGGLEATVDESSGSWTPVVNDAFGNTVGWISGGTMQWNPAQVASYGVLPGSTAQPFDGSHTLAESTLWRSHRIDPTGLYYLGARYYDPSSGRFISADPLGHGSSMSLYDYANGDPANLVDPDGRVAKVVGGGIIAGLGTVALLAPEPTMLSKVFGTAAVLYGADMMVSGVRGFAGGDSRTYTSQGASWTAQQLGASEQTAYWIGEGTDFVVGNVITLGTNAAIKSASSGVNLAANNASRLAPGGGLIAHEAQGGHLLARHLGQTESQLASRLASNPRLSTASTFGTRAEAEAAVSHAFDSNASALSSWLSSGAQGRQVLNAPWNGGTVLQRGASSAVPGTGVRIVLQGNGSGGYYILTGFPTP